MLGSTLFQIQNSILPCYWAHLTYYSMKTIGGGCRGEFSRSNAHAAFQLATSMLCRWWEWVAPFLPYNFVACKKNKFVFTFNFTLTFFMCCWPCILVIFDFMFQLNAPFLYYIYHIPIHVSRNFMLIIRRIHCIHTASGSLYVTLLRWPLSAQALPVHWAVT